MTTVTSSIFRCALVARFHGLPCQLHPPIAEETQSLVGRSETIITAGSSHNVGHDRDFGDTLGPLLDYLPNFI